MTRRQWSLTGSQGRAWILLAILLVAAGIRLFSFRGYWGADDAEYALLAHSMVRGDYAAFVQENYVEHFNAPAHLPYRIALIAPLAVLFKTFGVGDMTLAIYPLTVSMLGVLLAFACGRHFFGVDAGLIAAALWAVLPVDVDISSQFLPDGIASFYASVGVLVVLGVRALGPASRARLFAGGLAAGACFGLSWLSKESVVYLVPLCGVLIVVDTRRDVRAAVPLWAGVAVASAGILAAEMTVYLVTRGDFMLRLHENERSFVQTRAYLFYEGSRFGWPVGSSHAKALVKRLFLEGPSVIFLNSQLLFLPLLAAVGVARGLYWRDRAVVIPGLWLGSLALMYNFMTCSFASYTPLVLLVRYLHPLALPAAVLTGGLLVGLWRPQPGVEAVRDRGERLFWGGVVTVAVIGLVGATVFREARDVAGLQPIYDVKAVAGLVRPGDRLYTDPLSRKGLQFYWGYPAQMNVVDFEQMDRDDVEPGSFVLVDRYRLDWLDVNVSMWLTEDYGYHEPEFSGGDPAGWDVRWRSPYATLYRVE